MADTTGDKLDRLLGGLETLTTKIRGFDARLAAVEQVRADDDPSRKDEGGKLDKILEHLDSMHKRLDACEEKLKDSKRGDEGGKPEDGEVNPEDGEIREGARQPDSARADSANGGTAKFVAAQVKADRAYQCFADSAPRWLAGETLADYQRRLLTKLKHRSEQWKGVDLAKLDGAALAVASDQIYTDSIAYAASPASVGPGVLRESTERDATGRTITKFIGDPEACWAPFKMPTRNVVGMNIRGVSR